jgi:two-component system, LytTR family, sensor kinase
MAGQSATPFSCDLTTVRKKARPFGLSRRQGWGLLLLVYTGIFPLEFGYHYFDDLARGRAGTFGIRFLEEFTGVYIVFFLLPLVFRFARLYLFRSKGWLAIGLTHVAGAVVFSFLHTSLMELSRRLIAPSLGLGPYNYGNMLYRYPMEFSNDLLSYTVIVLAFYLVERLRIAQEQQLAAAELKTKLAEAQLENFRLQLQPHFLFNTLNTISAIMYENLEAADAMLQHLSDLLRLTLRAASSQEIPLNQELEITRLYLKIMQRRYEDKLRVVYRVAQESENSLVPQLILQPLVENSLRHGLTKIDSGIDIVIAAGRENGSLILKVTDSGTGLAGNGATGALRGEGLGLANISRRLEQLYGQDQQFAIANRTEGGAEVTLRLPFRLAGQSA